MTEEEIRTRVRELSEQNGGKIAMRSFLDQTGVTDHWLTTQAWYTGWNNLLASTGIEPRAFRQAKVPRDHIARSVASLALRLRKWPTDADLLRARKTDPEFPGIRAIRQLRRSGDLTDLIVGLAASDSGFVSAAGYAPPKSNDADHPAPETRRERVVGYVYMLRSGRRYKIGKSLDPSRRFREVKLQLPEETTEVHVIPTDDPSGIEFYWHRRFQKKRVRNTEFFELDAEDVRAFCRRKYQ